MHDTVINAYVVYNIIYRAARHNMCLTVAIEKKKTVCFRIDIDARQFEGTGLTRSSQKKNVFSSN